MGLIAQFTSRTREICFTGSLDSTRFILAVSETIWFISLIWSGETFNRPVYASMAALMSEQAWAMVFLLTASCQWYILYSKRYHTPWAVRFSAWNMCLWWYVVLSLYVSLYPPPAALSGELALALGASWIYVRSGLFHR